MKRESLQKEQRPMTYRYDIHPRDVQRLLTFRNSRNTRQVLWERIAFPHRPNTVLQINRPTTGCLSGKVRTEDLILNLVEK